jgi:hypothetical protein
MTNLATALVGFGQFGSFILIPQFVEIHLCSDESPDGEDIDPLMRLLGQFL